jgi:hypothetical protein
MKKKKSQRFTNWKLCAAVFGLDLTAHQTLLLGALCRHWPNIFPSAKTLMRESKVRKEQTFWRTLRELEQAGWVKRLNRKWESNHYQVDSKRILEGLKSPAKADPAQPVLSKREVREYRKGKHGSCEKGSTATIEKGSTKRTTDIVLLNNKIIEGSNPGKGLKSSKQAKIEPCLPRNDPGSPSAGALSEPVIADTSPVIDDAPGHQEPKTSTITRDKVENPFRNFGNLTLPGHILAPAPGDAKMKKCVQCGQTLPEGCFPPHKGDHGKLSLWCQGCIVKSEVSRGYVSSETLANLGKPADGSDAKPIVPVKSVPAMSAEQEQREYNEYMAVTMTPAACRSGPPDPFNNNQPSFSPAVSAKDEVLPADWKVVQDRPGRWLVMKTYDGGKSYSPFGDGPTRAAAISDAYRWMKRLKAMQASGQVPGMRD